MSPALRLSVERGRQLRLTWEGGPSADEGERPEQRHSKSRGQQRVYRCWGGTKSTTMGTGGMPKGRPGDTRERCCIHRTGVAPRLPPLWRISVMHATGNGSQRRHAYQAARVIPVSVKKHSSRKWKYKPSECQIRGWRAVSASGLQGRGSPKRDVFFTDTGSITRANPATGSAGAGLDLHLGQLLSDLRALHAARAHVYACIYIYIYVYVYMCVCMCIYIYIHIHLSLYIYIYIHTINYDIIITLNLLNNIILYYMIVYTYAMIDTISYHITLWLPH